MSKCAHCGKEVEYVTDGLCPECSKSCDDAIKLLDYKATILGFVYCGYFPLHLQLLRDMSSADYHDGLGFVVMMFTAILLTDVGCYYAGTRFGKHKLAPVISPNKTIEG